MRGRSQARGDVALRHRDICRTGFKPDVDFTRELRQSAQAHALDATGERRVRRDAQCGVSSGRERVDEGAVGVACHAVDGRGTGEADAHAAGGDLAQHDFDAVETAIDERERLFEAGGDACGLDRGATDNRPAGAERPGRLCVEVSVRQFFAALAIEDTDVLLATGERTAPALDLNADRCVVCKQQIMRVTGAGDACGFVQDRAAERVEHTHRGGRSGFRPNAAGLVFDQTVALQHAVAVSPRDRQSREARLWPSAAIDPQATRGIGARVTGIEADLCDGRERSIERALLGAGEQLRFDGFAGKVFSGIGAIAKRGRTGRSDVTKGINLPRPV